MKAFTIFISFFFLFMAYSCKPDPREVLEDSLGVCQKIENGSYQMEKRMKFMSGKDTSASYFDCHFMKLQSDSIFPVAFHYTHSYDTFPDRYVLYTGDEFVTYSNKDSTGEVMRKSVWADDIMRYKHNYTFYDAFTSSSNYPMAELSDEPEENYQVTLIGSEKVNDHSTYHVKLVEYPAYDSTDFMQTIKYEVNYWINKKDKMPVQYSIAYDLVMDNDTMQQYELFRLKNYEINKGADSLRLSLLSIPEHIKLEEYTPYESPELLAVGSEAPDWRIPDLNGDTLSLASLKGKIVLIDFFYKSCLPCMKALPSLQELHEKYQGEDFILVGIDPYDSVEKDEIDQFLEKKGVSYPVLLSEREVPKSYNVSAYPTIYIVDKQGKIAYVSEGHGDQTKAKLEQVINELL